MQSEHQTTIFLNVGKKKTIFKFAIFDTWFCRKLKIVQKNLQTLKQQIMFLLLFQGAVWLLSALNFEEIFKKNWFFPNNDNWRQKVLCQNRNHVRYNKDISSNFESTIDFSRNDCQRWRIFYLADVMKYCSLVFWLSIY
jgi:hypothetical protein